MSLPLRTTFTTKHAMKVLTLLSPQLCFPCFSLLQQEFVYGSRDEGRATHTRSAVFELQLNHKPRHCPPCCAALHSSALCLSAPRAQPSRGTTCPALQWETPIPGCRRGSDASHPSVLTQALLLGSSIHWDAPGCSSGSREVPSHSWAALLPWNTQTSALQQELEQGRPLPSCSLQGGYKVSFKGDEAHPLQE